MRFLRIKGKDIKIGTEDIVEKLFNKLWDTNREKDRKKIYHNIVSSTKDYDYTVIAENNEEAIISIKIDKKKLKERIDFDLKYIDEKTKW